MRSCFTRPSISALLTGALDDGGVVLVDGDALGASQMLQREALQLEAQVLGDRLATGQHGDVLQHLLAPIPEARRLDRADLQRAAQLVHHQRRQRLAVDVLGDDEQGACGLGHQLQQGQQILQAGKPLLVHQEEAVLQHRLHALGVGHEVGRQIAAVELHPLDHLQRGLHGLRLLDGDHPLLADLLHGLRQEVRRSGCRRWR